jgi:hypothetical protein
VHGQTIDREKVQIVLSAMRGHVAGWDTTAAEYVDEETGEVPEDYSTEVKYYQARDDAGCEVLFSLPGWIEFLTEALEPAPTQS